MNQIGCGITESDELANSKLFGTEHDLGAGIPQGNQFPAVSSSQDQVAFVHCHDPILFAEQSLVIHIPIRCGLDAEDTQDSANRTDNVDTCTENDLRIKWPSKGSLQFNRPPDTV